MQPFVQSYAVILFIPLTGYISSITYDSEVTAVFIIQKPHAKANISKTIRFTEELNNRMIALAQEEEVSFNELVIQCCQYTLDHHAKDDHGEDRND